MAVRKKSALKGAQTKRKSTKRKVTKSKSTSRTKAGRRAAVKTQSKRVKNSNHNAPGSRSALAALENLNLSELQRYFRPSLPASDDPWEEPCLETDPMPEGYVFVPKGDYTSPETAKATPRILRRLYTLFTIMTND
ncbi:hypothetical protein VTN77DRAFT_3227 [Rasamsonia byssochlamydoides]|uniref:uncharacterized protein n=1 Tax=Rasamsonia byssochlamydoides TaxID=89139 RepID=UPI0037427779